MSVDPFARSMSHREPGSFNRYAYVQSDPANLNDPTGLVFEDGDPTYDPCFVDPGIAFTPGDGSGGPGPVPCPGVQPPPTPSTPQCSIKLFSRPVPFNGSFANHTYLLVEDSDWGPPFDELIFEGGPVGPPLLKLLGFGGLYGFVSPPGQSPLKGSNPGFLSNHQIGGITDRSLARTRANY